MKNRIPREIMTALTANSVISGLEWGTFAMLSALVDHEDEDS